MADDTSAVPTAQRVEDIREAAMLSGSGIIATTDVVWLCDEIRRLTEELEKVRAALLQFGEHDVMCEADVDDAGVASCTCGYGQLAYPELFARRPST